MQTTEVDSTRMHILLESDYRDKSRLIRATVQITLVLLLLPINTSQSASCICKAIKFVCQDLVFICGGSHHCAIRRIVHTSESAHGETTRYVLCIQRKLAKDIGFTEYAGSTSVCFLRSLFSKYTI